MSESIPDKGTIPYERFAISCWYKHLTSLHNIDDARPM